MGYPSIRIPAARTPLPKWLDPMTERAFQERLFEGSRVIAKNRATRGAYNQVFAAYLRDAASDGFRDGSWRYEDGAFHFAFPDHGGSFMSMTTSLHFIEVGAAIIQAELIHKQQHGWHVQLDRSLVDVLNHNEQPLVELGKTLYVLGKYKRTFTLTTDDGLPTQDWSALSEEDQARLEARWKSKTCGCQLCDYYRPRAAKAAAKAKAK